VVRVSTAKQPLHIVIPVTLAGLKVAFSIAACNTDAMARMSQLAQQGFVEMTEWN